MDLDSYVDGIISLLEKAGVTEEEYNADDLNNAYDLAVHCHMKGISFSRAARDILKRFNVEIRK